MTFMDQFRQSPQQQPTVAQQLQGLRRMAGGDTQALVSSVAQANPAFAHFLRQHQGQTPRQAAASMGIDLDRILGQ